MELYVKSLVYTPNSSTDTKEILRNRAELASVTLKADTEMIQLATINFVIHRAELCTDNERRYMENFL